MNTASPINVGKPVRRAWSVCGALMGVAFSSTIALGVDPLPPEIERASPKVQLEYLERRGRESDRLKREVAQRRYEERQQYREAVAQGMSNEAEARRQAFYRETGGRVAMGQMLADSSDEMEGSPILLRSLLAALVLGGLLYRYRHHIFARYFADTPIINSGSQTASMALAGGSSMSAKRLPPDLIAFARSAARPKPSKAQLKGLVGKSTARAAKRLARAPRRPTRPSRDSNPAAAATARRILKSYY